LTKPKHIFHVCLLLSCTHNTTNMKDQRLPKISSNSIKVTHNFVDFNLVQLITANRFLIKIEKIQWHTHITQRFYPFTLETQTGKTNNLFRATPLILYSSSIFIVYNTIYIGSHGIQNP
jgi:hypothetical protein